MPTLTLKVKQNIGLVIFKHLCYELDVHVLNIDFLDRVRQAVE